MGERARRPWEKPNTEAEQPVAAVNSFARVQFPGETGRVYPLRPREIAARFPTTLVTRRSSYTRVLLSNVDVYECIARRITLMRKYNIVSCTLYFKGCFFFLFISSRYIIYKISFRFARTSLADITTPPQCRSTDFYYPII